MKNKLISLALALVMCLGLAIPASAAEDQTPEKTDDAVVAPSGEKTEASDEDKTPAEDGEASDEDAAPAEDDKDADGEDAAPAEDDKAAGDEDTTPAEDDKDADDEEKPVNPFTDVSENSPFYNAILWAVEQGITAGTGDGTTFSPNNTCTRAQIITFLWRSAGKPEAELEESPYSDVSADSMNADFYSAIMWAAENEMAEGETFNPNDPCTRAMAVDFIWKAAVKAEDEEIETPSFTDVDEDNPYMDGIAWAVAHEITMGTGDGTTFSPDNSCTRGQIVTFLYRTASTPAPLADK